MGIRKTAADVRKRIPGLHVPESMSQFSGRMLTSLEALRAKMQLAAAGTEDLTTATFAGDLHEVKFNPSPDIYHTWGVKVGVKGVGGKLLPLNMEEVDEIVSEASIKVMVNELGGAGGHENVLDRQGVKIRDIRVLEEENMVALTMDVIVRPGEAREE